MSEQAIAAIVRRALGRLEAELQAMDEDVADSSGSEPKPQPSIRSAATRWRWHRIFRVCTLRPRTC
jgi:hypothetical protein